ncbi:MAG TPA: glycosyltransferase family 4 protein [Candidatus Kapabacteria bacterium]|nr:glycosyltransferase family 4 protein [Candidatus Kapabacteria bacterium]
MRILQLSPRFPFPLVDGGAIGIYKPTEAIAKLGHEITFVTFPDPDPEITRAGIEELQRFCRIELVSKPLPSRSRTLIRTIFTGAYPIERRMMPEMFSLIKRLLDESKFDLVHIDASHMGKYGMWIKENYSLPIVLRQHNFETLIYRRFAQNTRNPFAKIVANMHAKRMLAEETKIIAGHDIVVAITPEDEAQMKNYAPMARYKLISAGVDTDYYNPQPVELEENRVLWVGGMDWEPNLDAVTFFAKEIFPKIVEDEPNIGFDIIGSGTERLGAIAHHSQGRIKLYGRVPDIRPFLAKAKVLVCPLRVGSGMRLKLLDFFAAGKAVVSTRIGAEGNKGTDGTHLFLRDDAESFAISVLRLLRDAPLRAQIGANARKLTEDEYSWQRIAQEFVKVYEGVLERS